MTRLKLYILIIVLLILTVPWGFITSDMKSIGGFPFWAFYSLLATFLYAIIIYYFIQKFWSLSTSNKHMKK